jgi:hypothetical protein
MILWAAVTAPMLLGLYLASYLFFVKPATFCRKEIWPVYVWRENPLWSQEFWTSLYAPVHWFDFRLRKNLWQPSNPREFRGRFYYRPGLTTIEDWGRTSDEMGTAEMSNAESGSDEFLRTSDEAK